MAALQFDRGRPFPSQLLAFPRESLDVTAVERDAAKLGLRCAAVLAGPSKIPGPCVAVGTPLRANSSPELNLAGPRGFFSHLLGALPPRPGGAGPPAGDGSQFLAVLRLKSKSKLAYS